MVTATAILGCSQDDSPPEVAQGETGAPHDASSTSEPVAESQAPSPAEREAQLELLDRLAVAQLFYDKGDYLTARDTLRKALQDSQATDRSSAEKLLDLCEAEVVARGLEVASTSENSSLSKTGMNTPGETSSSQRQTTSNTSASETRSGTTVPDPTAALTKLDAKPTESSSVSDPNSIPAPPVASEAVVDPPLSQFTLDHLPETRERADEEMVKNLEYAAKKAYSAHEALAMYYEFRQIYELDSDPKAKFEQYLVNWEDKSSQELFRLGSRWENLKDVKEAAANADTLIREAIAHIQAGRFLDAKNALEQASRADLNGVRADFLLGMLNSRIGFVSLLDSLRHFTVASNRLPESVSIFNNLALTQFNVGEHGDAIVSWEKALKLNPRSQEVTQNLGRVLADNEKSFGNIKKLPMKDSMVARYRRAYDSAIAAGAARYNPTVGWRFMPLILSQIETHVNKNDKRRILERNSGTGIVVRPGYVVTSREVVEHERYGIADHVRIIDGNRKLTARLVGVWQDLALLKIPTLNRPAAALATTPPEAGSNLELVGFESTSGQPLQGLSGKVLGQGWDFKRRRLTVAVEGNADVFGSIGVDPQQRVSAILTRAIGTSSLFSDGAQAFAVTSNYIQEFVNKELGDGAQNTPIAVAAGGPLSQSIVKVQTYMYDTTFGLGNLAVNDYQATNDYLEDITCTHCRGSSLVGCGERDCKKGNVQYRKIVGQKKAFGVVQNIWGVAFRPCTTCCGTGSLDCLFCLDGRDYSLRGFRQPTAKLWEIIGPERERFAVAVRAMEEEERRANVPYNEQHIRIAREKREQLEMQQTADLQRAQIDFQRQQAAIDQARAKAKQPEVLEVAINLTIDYEPSLLEQLRFSSPDQFSDEEKMRPFDIVRSRDFKPDGKENPNVLLPADLLDKRSTDGSTQFKEGGAK